MVLANRRLGVHMRGLSKQLLKSHSGLLSCACKFSLCMSLVCTLQEIWWFLSWLADGVPLDSFSLDVFNPCHISSSGTEIITGQGDLAGGS